MARLLNKVAIITGAAMGQGAAEARLFAKEGAKVVATDVEQELLEKVVKEIKDIGGEAIALKHNVANIEEWNYVVKESVKAFGKIDILVNNAGIGAAEGLKALDDVDLHGWDKIMSVNSTGNFLGIKAVVPEMRKAGKGSIVNISSIAGIVGGAAGVHYSASKGANRLLTKSAAVELGKDNIRVNCVHPGFISTPMTSIITENKELVDSALKNIPLGLVGEPEDIANLVLFLSSDAARFITGSEVVIDGGYTAR